MAEKKYLDQNGLSHLKSKMDLTYAKKGEAGATDYNSLSGLPTLDGTEIKGTMTKESLGIASKEDIPTDNSELANGAGYQTADDVEQTITEKGYQTESQVTTAIDKAIADINKKQIVTSTEEMTDENIIYLIKNEGEENNSYDEYLVIEGKPEKIGTTKVDLTGYLKETDLTSLTNEEIDEIFNS